jgi:hypothetical protein
MYTQSWDKYLPVLRILIKRSVDGVQNFKLNLSDFEKIGPARKTGFKFALRFSKGRANETIGLPQIAKDLAYVLLHDPVINQLFVQHEYHISMNTKFALTILMVQPAGEAEDVAHAQEAGNK